MRKLFSAIVGTCFAILAATGASVSADWKYNNWMPPKSMEGVEIPKLASEMKKATGGGLSMRVFSGGQLLGPRATLAGIRDGVADAGFIVPSINASELPHLAMLPDLLPFGRDGFSAAAAADETIMVDCPECQKDLEGFNAMWLGGFGTTPWVLMCSKPIKNLADLKGRKARVTGGMATRMITALGGVGVNMNPPSINQALAKGQIDCTFGPIDWMVTLRLRDVVKVVMDYNLGQFHGLGWFVVNRKSLDALTAEQKATIKQNLADWNASYTNAYVQRAEKITADLKKEGIQFWKPTQDIVDALDAYRKNEPAAVAADMRKRGVKDPEKLIKAHLAKLKKWEKIVDDAKWDKNAIAAAMKREIYDKVSF
jgi:TRAP-type C4-dicarboxylate transport system substrate-binding protein